MQKIIIPDKVTGDERTADEDNHVKTVVNHNADEMALNTAHKSNTENPHGVTKAQVGLGRVDDVADRDKEVSIPQAEALALKVDIESIEDSLESASRFVPLSANQGKVLKGLVDAINAVLLSDESTLDTIQEIVDFIEQNKETLDTLSVAGIAGLQTALDLKANQLSLDVVSNIANAALPKSGGTLTGALLGDQSARLYRPQSNNNITINTNLDTLTPNTTILINTYSNSVTITVTDLANTNPIGTVFEFIWRTGDHDVVFASDGSQSILSADNFRKMRTKFCAVVLTKQLNNTWYLIGDLKA